MTRRFSIALLALTLCAGSLAFGARSPAAKARFTARERSEDPCTSAPSKWQRFQCEQSRRSAPGDEYFGRMKLSYLGIDNTAHDVAIEAGAYTTDPRLIARIGFADEALHQWERKYPGDPQLARSYFLMIEVYRKMYTRDAQRKAWAYMQHILHAYPSSYFAKVLRVDVQRGFTEHWFALPQICQTPDARGYYYPPAPSPSESPAASATATPTPVRGAPSVDIITSPCVQPATPTPLPLPMATGGPEATASPHR